MLCFLSYPVTYLIFTVVFLTRFPTQIQINLLIPLARFSDGLGLSYEEDPGERGLVSKDTSTVVLRCWGVV